MLRAIGLAKKKNDRIDAGKIADCLRCDFLPECHISFTEIRDRRRSLRYPHLLVRQSLPPFPAFLVDSLLCDHGHNCTKGERSRRGGRGRVLSSSHASHPVPVLPRVRYFVDSRLPVVTEGRLP